MTDSFLLNLHLGRYEIRDRLGAGGMARVFKGYDSNLERLVAIKILHDHLADEPTFRERFIREAKFIASLNHPNIVQVYDFDVAELGGNHQCLYYMVMPYIPGKSLKAVMDERGTALPQAQVIEIMRNLSDALGYAHAQGMVHRDVKPANILFNERGQAVLTDFGIARLVENSSLTQEGMTTGTPAYMSPEQVLGLPVDARSDQYALGVIAFEMLTGQLPFPNDNTVSVMLKHVNEPIPRISQFLTTDNSHLDAVIYRALAKQQEDRYNTTNEFFTDLTTALTGQPVTPDEMQTTPPFLRTQTTQIMANTVVMPDPSKTSLPRTSLGLVAVAITVIAFIGAIILMERGNNVAADISNPQVESMTGDMALYFNGTFEADSPYNDYWPQTPSSEIEPQISDGFYRLYNPEPGTAATSIFGSQYTYEDAIIHLEGALADDSQPASAYGIVFNYRDSDNYNVFAVDGVGRYSMWKRQAGVWQELRDADEQWTATEVVLPLGEMNSLRVEVHGSHFAGYVNDVLVADVVADESASGQIGIYLATTRSGTASALIDHYAVMSTTASAPSMTGETDEP
jgi:serine/threonine protein kinase